jgi:sugar/nucleoside kinase (ribokinase family)
MIVDLVKMIDAYPPELSLTSISSVEMTMGGAVCNCGLDLAILDPTLPVAAIGVVGPDEHGDYILGRMGGYPTIDLSRVRRRGRTAFTDVMTRAEGGARTFFTYKGANDLLVPADFDFSGLAGSLLHVGYVALLDGLDAPDAECGTAMARVLKEARGHGLRTSVDVVTEARGRHAALLPPSLRYADYCAINETEAEAVTGVRLRGASGELLRSHLEAACRALKAKGVANWAAVHAPEASAGVDEAGRFVELPSLRLPEGYIKGSVGAGDAFASGLLYAAYRGLSLAEALELGTAVAASSLSEPGSTEGVRGLGETMELYRRMRG